MRVEHKWMFTVRFALQQPLGATGLAAEPGAAAAEAKLANLEASVKIGMAQVRM